MLETRLLLSYPPEVDFASSPTSSRSDPPFSKPNKDSRPRRSSSHSRSSSRSISNLLILTNEQLSLANTRNAALEAQKEELLLRFATLVKEKASVEAELRATQESLRLHKVQLELAQKEVNRATEVVRGVDRARVQAESEATRLRSRVRHLESEKVTREGWEEGWDIGFQEGMAQAQAEGGLMDRFIHRRTRSSVRRRAGSKDSERDADPPISSPASRARSPSIRTSVPDVAPHAHPVPIPTVTTPAPLDIPSTQPQQPTPRPLSASRTRERAHSITSKFRPRSRSQNRPHQSRSSDHPFEEQSSSPEIIHPLPHRPSSPTISHHSTIPPDNYIPMMAHEDNFIHLPPPHELSVPVPSATPVPSEPEFKGRRGSMQVPRSRAMSDISRASTRISEYDLVSPPPQERSHNTDVEMVEEDSRRMVEEWRNIVTPPPHEVSRRAQTPPQIRSPMIDRRSRSPRVSGGPRQQRAIVQPVPLNTLLNSDHLDVQRIADQHPPRYYRPEQQQQQPQQVSRYPARSTTTEDSPPAGTARTKTPIAWLKKQFQRSYSSPVVPNIEIEPPSQTPTTESTNVSTRLDPVLLSPEDANRPIPLPNGIIAEATRGVSVLPSSTPLPNYPIRIQLPDEELPLGFVPMTPVMTFHNDNTLVGPHEDSGSMFSPIPDNYSLPDPFRSASPVQRPATVTGFTKGEKMGKEADISPRSGTMSFGGNWGWASPEHSSPDSARLSRPLSLFSDD
ncbi:hypothetical protein GYMLUDRAFT_236296 [Collybiopsis luxurians FD-317 M1]|nr:hypothetical protein GYMLUDRAFT_236296 [Collybiopsis luxurians FD-317 M1]